jgi:hypothetical protein
VRYADRLVPVSIKQAFLVEVEEELRRRVSAAATMLACVPTQAVLGDHCRHCDVRQFCETYWADRSDLFPGRTRAVAKETSLDVEVTVVGEPSGSGFDAQATDAGTFPVVFREEVALIHGPFVKGERLRILGSQTIEGGALELRPWTEVFHRGLS